MFGENQLLFGVSFLIFGVVFLYFNFNNDDYKKENEWDIAMLFKGLIGGLSVIVIGVVLIMKHFEIL